MAFSVLMSLYIKENPLYLRQSLDSVFNQTQPPDEVILVEDGPLTNELYEVLEEFKKNYSNFITIPLSENQGLGKALNVGLIYCSHELVARMDTDDICFPNRFEKQIKFMSENPDIDISGSFIEEFEDSISNKKDIKTAPLTHSEISQYIKSRNPLNHPTVIFRKSAVLNAGGYQHFPLFEDWFLWVRMYLNGKKFANIQEPLLHFRVSKDMYNRRGGFKYAKDSTRFQWMLYQNKLKSLPAFIKDSSIRGTVYLMPTKLREFIYTNFLRS